MKVVVLELPPLTTVAARMVLSALILLPLLGMVGARVPRDRSLWLLGLGLGSVVNVVPTLLRSAVSTASWAEPRAILLSARGLSRSASSAASSFGSMPPLATPLCTSCWQSAGVSTGRRCFCASSTAGTSVRNSSASQPNARHSGPAAWSAFRLNNGSLPGPLPGALPGAVRVAAVEQSVEVVVGAVVADLDARGRETLVVGAVDEAVAFVVDAVVAGLGTLGPAVAILTVERAVAVVVGLVVANLFAILDLVAAARGEEQGGGEQGGEQSVSHGRQSTSWHANRRRERVAVGVGVGVQQAREVRHPHAPRHRRTSWLHDRRNVTARGA
jgi:hypothetical protein